MKKKILFIILLFVLIINFPIVQKEAKAQSILSWCPTATWSHSDDCLVSCSDLNIINAGSTGVIASCTGRASKFQITIRKMELGTPDGWSGYKCSVLSDSVTVDLISKAAGQTFSGLNTDFKKCKSVVYDRLYFTLDRNFVIAGNTSYPDTRGYIARTTTFCPTDSLTETSDSLLSNLSYQDELTSVPLTTKCYSRPSNTWNNVYKTAKSGGTSSIDYASATDQPIQFDDYKGFYIVSLNGPPYTNTSTSRYVPTDTTFRGEFGNNLNGQKIDPSDSTKEIFLVIKGSDTLSGNAVGQTLQKNKSQTITLSLFSASVTKGYGIDFLFKRNGSNAELVGYKPGDPGVYFEYNQQ